MSSPRLSALLLSAVLFLAVFAVACNRGDSSGSPTPTLGATQIAQHLDSPRRIELITTLVTEYYPVEGLSTEGIFSYIERHGPTDGDGKRGSGLTSVVWAYEWQGARSNGRCAISLMTIRADMEVTLPEHVDESALARGIRHYWQDYAAGVAQHEQTHVEIYEEGAQDLKRRMEAIAVHDSCDSLEEEIKRVWTEEQNRINARQAAFHNAEYERLARERAPIGAQIEANRSRIATLQRDIEAQQRAIATYASEIESLVRDIATVDEQIRQVNASSQSTEEKHARLVVLVQQRNNVQNRHNGVVDQHNAAVDAWRRLVEERDRLIVETNNLIELFNWTR